MGVGECQIAMSARMGGDAAALLVQGPTLAVLVEGALRDGSQ
jgi:hypothetical protein